MSGTVGRVTGQILGKAQGTTTGPATIISVTSTVAAGQGNPNRVVILSPSVLSGLQVGDTVTVYVARDAADIAAIESAVSVVDLLGTT